MRALAAAPLGIMASLALAFAGGAARAPAWHLQNAPKPIGATGSYLDSVACPSATECIAIGGYSTGSGRDRPLAERWDGRSWVIQRLSLPANTELSAVACPAINNCIAVGAGSRPLAEHWDGRAWNIQHVAEPRGVTDANLTSVACPATATCEAVGVVYRAGDGQWSPLAERWDGTAWAIQPIPAIGDADILQSIACSSARDCTAVGFAAAGAIPKFTLAERWDGTAWAIQPTPNPAGANSIVLSSVACPSATTCIAVGTTDVGPFAERWTGSAWVIDPMTNLNLTRGLAGVACPSRRTCISVGRSSNGSSAITLAERWNGKTWAIQPTPNPAGSTFSELSGIACPARRLCTVVGAFIVPAGVSSSALVERWAPQDAGAPVPR
jgi:hypothetical protein